MTGNEYKELAMRTNDGKCKDRLINSVWNEEKYNVADAIDAALGLSGEVGELNDLLKKAIYHGHTIDRADVKKELGDIQWYIAMMCHAFGFELDDVMQVNIEKLKARYPNGFSESASQNREE